MRVYVKKKSKFPIFIWVPTILCTNKLVEKIIVTLINKKAKIKENKDNNMKVHDFLSTLRNIKKENKKLCIVDVKALDGTMVKITL